MILQPLALKIQWRNVAKDGGNHPFFRELLYIAARLSIGMLSLIDWCFLRDVSRLRSWSWLSRLWRRSNQTLVAYDDIICMIWSQLPKPYKALLRSISLAKTSTSRVWVFGSPGRRICSSWRGFLDFCNSPGMTSILMAAQWFDKNQRIVVLTEFWDRGEWIQDCWISKTLPWPRQRSSSIHYFVFLLRCHLWHGSSHGFKYQTPFGVSFSLVAKHTIVLKCGRALRRFKWTWRRIIDATILKPGQQYLVVHSLNITRNSQTRGLFL